MSDLERMRLVGAVQFLAAAMTSCPAKQLFIGLYTLDVLHFQKTGRTVTGLKYFVGNHGPYPDSLSGELEGYLRPDLGRVVAVEHVPGLARNDIVRPITDETAVDELFSPREAAILREVASRMPFPNLAAAASSVDSGASHRARELGKHRPIDFADTVGAQVANREAVLQQAREYQLRAERLRLLAA